MIRTGTSGFSYKEWKGAFYPEDLPAKGMLAYYSERLPAVEINNTFYRMPQRSVLEGWAAQVSSEFRFVLKASRRITHFKRLQDTADDTAYLFEIASALGERLGGVLFQLPPTSKKNAELLATFLATLPPGPRVALEFRHESWYDDEVFDLLRGRDVALVVADTDEGETAPLVRTGSWGYVRLRRTEYPDGSLAAWRELVVAMGWDEAYVFFKHEDDCAGPEMAARFLAGA